MKMKRLAAFILSASMLFAGVSALADTEDGIYPYSGEYGAFEEICEAVSELYIDDSYTKEKIMIGGVADVLSDMLDNNETLLVEILKKSMESLDDYSEFYTAEEYKAFENQLNHTFYGIGVMMQQDGEYVKITGFAEGSDNAERAGFKIGDIFYKVNGQDVTGMSMSAVRSLIIGEEGTTVSITVLRDGKEIDLTATRVAVNAATVSTGILDGNIGYIQITTFGTDTAGEFEKALAYMRENKVKNIILDLRNNGGGLVPAAVSIAQSIVPKGKIIDVEYRQSQYNTTYTSKLGKKEFDFIVLVNENTASASEILASAVQDSGAGILLGMQTFGKAVIQNTFPLKNEAVFKITVGQYITRNGNEINKIGLTPDRIVENKTDKFDITTLTELDYKTRIALGTKNENVKAAKERLSILGFYGGEIDDVYDTEMKDAVRSFQSRNGLLDYGILDAPTQQLLDELTAEVDVITDTQLEEAYKAFGGDVTKLYNE